MHLPDVFLFFFFSFTCLLIETVRNVLQRYELKRCVPKRKEHNSDNEKQKLTDKINPENLRCHGQCLECWTRVCLFPLCCR